MEERTERIQIDESVIDIYKVLSEGDSPEDVPFNTMRDIFLLAACTAFENGSTRTPLPASSKKITIRQDVFGDDGLAVMRALAIAATGDVATLADEGQVLTIAEELAHIGIHDLQNQLLNSLGRPLWNLVS